MNSRGSFDVHALGSHTHCKEIMTCNQLTTVWNVITVGGLVFQVLTWWIREKT